MENLTLKEKIDQMEKKIEDQVEKDMKQKNNQKQLMQDLKDSYQKQIESLN